MIDLGLALPRPKGALNQGQYHGDLLLEEQGDACDDLPAGAANLRSITIGKRGNHGKRRPLSPKPISPRPPVHPTSHFTPRFEKESSSDDSLGCGEVDESLNSATRGGDAWESDPGFSSEGPQFHASSCSYLSLTPNGTAILVTSSGDGDSSRVEGHVGYRQPHSFSKSRAKLNPRSSLTGGLRNQVDGNTPGVIPITEQLQGLPSTLSKRPCALPVPSSSRNVQNQAEANKRSESGQTLPVSPNHTLPDKKSTSNKKHSSTSVEDLVNRYKNLQRVQENHLDIIPTKTCSKSTPTGSRRSSRSHRSLTKARRPANSSTSFLSGDDTSLAGTVGSSRHHRSLSERRHRSSFSPSKRSGRRNAANKSDDDDEALSPVLPRTTYGDEQHLLPRRRYHDMEGHIVKVLDLSPKAATSDPSCGEEITVALSENSPRRSSRARRSLKAIEQPTASTSYLSGEDSSVAGTVRSGRHHRSLTERRHRSSLSSFKRSHRKNCANKDVDESEWPSRPTATNCDEQKILFHRRHVDMDRHIEKSLERVLTAPHMSDPRDGKEAGMIMSPHSSRRHRRSSLPSTKPREPKLKPRRGSRDLDNHVGETLALASTTSASFPEKEETSSRRHRSLSERRRQVRREQEEDGSQRSNRSRSRRTIRPSHSSTTLRHVMMSPRQQAIPHHNNSETLVETVGSAAPSVSPSRSRLSASLPALVSPNCVMMDVSFHSRMYQVDDLVVTKLKEEKIALQEEKMAASSPSRTTLDKNLLRRIGTFLLHPA